MLERLGIYGMGPIEVPLLAGLVLREPILLVGGHGTAKTLLCQRLAEGLGRRFWAYDASKALFEDILGFPDPGSLERGAVDYVPTPLSIWDKEFVLVDELSRANPAMQNKWLEVIRGRRIMGRAIPRLEQVIAAMNPPSYMGANPLDEALAGRFAVILEVPEAAAMAPADVEQIIQSRDAASSTAIGDHDGGMGPDPAPTSDLGALLDRARRVLAELPPAIDERLTAYVRELNVYLAAREAALDGRRLGMIWRGLRAGLAVRAVQEGRGAVDAAEPLGPVVETLLPATLPFAVVDRDVHDHLVGMAHAAAAPLLADPSAPPSPSQMRPDSPLKAAIRLRAAAPELSTEQLRGEVSWLVARTYESGSGSRRMEAAVAVTWLAREVSHGRLRLEADEQFRLLDRCLRLQVPDSENHNELGRLAERLGENVDRVDRFTDPAGFAALRMASTLRGRHGGEVEPVARDADRILELAAALAHLNERKEKA